MITPAEAKRMVAKRDKEEADAKRAAEEAKRKALETTIENVTSFVSDNGFIDYATEQIDCALSDAIKYKHRLFVGFTTYKCGEEDNITNYAYFGEMERGICSSARTKVTLCLFATHRLEIDGETKVIADLLSTGLKTLYEESGWVVNTADQRGLNWKINSENCYSHYGNPILFELVYDEGLTFG